MSLPSAYNHPPFFEYYKNDFRPLLSPTPRNKPLPGDERKASHKPLINHLLNFCKNSTKLPPSSKPNFLRRR